MGYEAASGTLTFGAGETSKTISVPVLDDTGQESVHARYDVTARVAEQLHRHVHARHFFFVHGPAQSAVSALAPLRQKVPIVDFHAPARLQRLQVRGLAPPLVLLVPGDARREVASRSWRSRGSAR